MMLKTDVVEVVAGVAVTALASLTGSVTSGFMLASSLTTVDSTLGAGRVWEELTK